MLHAGKVRRDGRKHLQSLIAAFLAQLVPAQEGDPEAIHRLRVSGRRLRTLLPLLAQDPKAQQVRRARRLLHELTRAAAGRRDHDVRLALLGKLPARDAELFGALRQRLRSAKQRAQRDLRRELRDADSAKLRKRLRATLEDSVACRATLTRIAALQRVEHGTLRSSLTKLGRRFDAEVLHADRRRLRRLRYAVELQDHLLRRKPPALPVLRHMQTQLGDIHDHWLLAQWLQTQVTGCGSQREALAVRRLHTQVLQMARARHRAWLAGNPMQRLESAFQFRGTRSLP